MTQSFSVAIVGATGTVGETLVSVLEERKFPVKELYLLASDESAGKSLSFFGRQVRVKALESFDFSKAELVFLCANAEVSLQLLPALEAANCCVIDLSAAFGLEQAPVVVPEYAGDLAWQRGVGRLISCPNQVAAPIALVLKALAPLVEWVSLDITAMLSASAQGKLGVQTLARETAQLLNGIPLSDSGAAHQTAFNVLAQLSGTNAQGHTSLELRTVYELRQVTGSAQLAVSVDCALIPGFFGDSVSLTVQSRTPIDLNKALALLNNAPSIECVEDDYPSAVSDAVGQDEVYVGRVRNGVDDSSRLKVWIASDNVRKGSALNAVQIAELLIKPYL